MEAPLFRNFRNVLGQTVMIWAKVLRKNVHLLIDVHFVEIHDMDTILGISTRRLGFFQRAAGV